jgi:hypothetical protein
MAKGKSWFRFIKHHEDCRRGGPLDASDFSVVWSYSVGIANLGCR